MAVRFRVLGPRAMGILFDLFTSNGKMQFLVYFLIFSNTLYRAAICTAPLIKAGQIISFTYIGTSPVLANLPSFLGGTNENKS